MKKNILVCLTIFLIILKLIVILGNETGPFIVNDEYIYKKSSELLFYFKEYKDFHYPPVYSFILLPGFLFGDWYKAFLSINVVASTFLIPATWFLATASGVKKSNISAMLAATLPFHLVYPNYILSENIFVPLFVFSFALAMRGDKSSIVESGIFGGTLALTHLTKYMFLPSVPVLFLAWAVKKVCVSKKRNIISIISECSMALIVYAFLMSLWIIYGIKSGVGVAELFGMNISAVGKLIINTASTIERIQSNSQVGVGFWIVLYISFLFLKWNLLFGFVGVWAAPKKGFFKALNADSKYFVGTSLLLVCGYVFMAIMHSVGAKYNFSAPSKIMGRYLVHLGPIFLVLFTLVLEDITLDCRRINMKKYMLAVMAVLAIGGFCWWTLIDDGIWEVPSFFYKHEINLSDVTFFGLGGYLGVTLLVVVSPIIYNKMSMKKEWILIVPLVLYFSSMSLGYLRNMPFHSEPICIKKILETTSKPHFNKKDVCIITENIHISEKQLSGAYDFWNIKTDSRVNLIRSKVNDYSTLSCIPLLLVTHREYDFLELSNYRFKNKMYKIYQIN